MNPTHAFHYLLNKQVRSRKVVSRYVTTLFSITLFFLLLTSPLTADVDADKYDRKQALATSQAALNRVIGNYHFLDETKNPVSITDYRGKPLVISLIFTSCHHICPTLTKNLADVVKIARSALGENSFSVLTIGFDSANDTPERMHLYKRERGIDMPGWHFLSTDEDTIKALTDELGFIFFPSSMGFDHLSQVSVLDADGKVYRQIYGVSFSAPDLGEPLKELVYGKRRDAGLVEGWLNNIKLFCTIYDPNSGRYEFDYSIFIGVIMGILILGAIAAFIVREWRHTRINRT